MRFTLAVPLGLALGVLAGCGPSWPPPRDACIQSQSGRGRGARPRYFIAQQRATRQEVIDMVVDREELRDGMREDERLADIGTGLLIGGPPVIGIGVVITLAQKAPPLAVIPVAALGATIAGVVLVSRGERTFRIAVTRFNERAAREPALCKPPPQPPPPPPPPPVRVEDVLTPRYGPRPLAP